MRTDAIACSTNSPMSPKKISRLCASRGRFESTVGLATDGDADRFASSTVTARGSSQSDSRVVYDYLVETRHWKMPAPERRHHQMMTPSQIARPNCFSNASRLQVHWQLIREDKIAMGGEESAGSPFAHIPEKDGILACLLVAE